MNLDARQAATLMAGLFGLGAIFGVLLVSLATGGFGMLFAALLGGVTTYGLLEEARKRKGAK